MILKTYYFYLWFPNKIQLHIIDQIKVLRVTIIYAYNPFNCFCDQKFDN